MRARMVVGPALIALVATISAEAAQRTFVSTTGIDTNACSLVAPCRSFGAALSHTDSGGEVIVVDSGAYGRVTISQPVTIEAPAGVYAGISVFAATNGIDVNAPGATVTLRGLSINGQGGDIGIDVSAVGFLRIDRCRISSMGAQGVVITSGSVVITNAYINDNGHDGVSADGVVDVVVQNTVSAHNLSGAAFFNGARAVLRDSTFTKNKVYGLYASGGPTATPTTLRADGIDVSYSVSTGMYLPGVASGFLTVTITRSTIVGNAGNGLYANGASGPVDVTISDSTFSNHHTAGLPAIAAGGTTNMVVSRSVVVDNASVAFFQFSGALFESRGDNTVRNNNGGGAQTAGTITTFGGT